MRSGAIVLYGIRVSSSASNEDLPGEQRNIARKRRAVEAGATRGVHRVDARLHRDHPDLWNEDIGV